MKLSERHETMLEAFLRRQSEAAVHLPAERRAQAVSVLRKRIDQSLESLESGELSDRDLIRVLDEVVASIRRSKSETTKADPLPKPETKEPSPVMETPKEALPQLEESSSDPVGSSERVWLGVCLYLSQRRSISIRLVRGSFLLLGLLTGPLALAVYFGMYASARSAAQSPPALSWGDVYRGMAGVTIWLLVLYGAALGLMMASHFFYVEVIGRPPIIEGWDWLQQRQNLLFVSAIVVVLPLCVLSALPVRSDWVGTLNKIVSAGVALYGVILSLGLASFLTGIMLKIVEEYAG